MNKQRLQIEQLDTKFRSFTSLASITAPPVGWVKVIRLALGMTLKQLANRLSITKQSTQEIEKREKEGTITIKSLREVAKALDMELVYGFVPKDGSIDALIERKAKVLATKIVSRTSNSMQLEDQANSKKRIQKAINERATLLKNEMPKILWD